MLRGELGSPFRRVRPLGSHLDEVCDKQKKHRPASERMGTGSVLRFHGPAVNSLHPHLSRGRVLWPCCQHVDELDWAVTAQVDWLFVKEGGACATFARPGLPFQNHVSGPSLQ